MRKRGDRWRALRRAAGEEAAEFLVQAVALRAGQVVWYLVTLPLRLLAQGFGGL